MGYTRRICTVGKIQWLDWLFLEITRHVKGYGLKVSVKNLTIRIQQKLRRLPLTVRDEVKKALHKQGGSSNQLRSRGGGS